MAKSTQLAKLLSDDRIAALTRPSNIRYGTAIYKRGGVKVISAGDDRVEAWVGGLDGNMAEGGSQRRRTELSVHGGELRWRCTESAKPDLIFCKHCVALALAINNGDK